MEGADIVESPRKRQKTDNDNTSSEEVAVAAKPAADGAQLQKEIEVGITEFVSPENEGFSGILKKRYTDFLVNEILTTGQVLHLKNVATQEQKKEKKDIKPEPADEPATENTAPKAEEPKPAETAPEPAPEFNLSDEDRTTLNTYFGEDATDKIVSLHKRAQASNARPSAFDKIATSVMTDRDQRIQVHQAIRRVFNSQLESSTDGEGMMWISAAPNRSKRNGQGGQNGRGGRDANRNNWQELGGPYLHFTIYKENKDTMEVISFLARTLKTNPKSFQFAGTKDRRGVTVQRACAHKVKAERLAHMNKTLRNARLGDFEYREHGLELGDLNGNEFVITLRESDIPGVDLNDRETAISKANDLVGTALRNLRERGYFNYYGLQRFGTFSTRTDTIGVKMLQGDFKAACEAILQYPPHVLAAAQDQSQDAGNISTDDKARARAIHHFQSTGKSAEALEILPRKFSAEMNLIRHLGRSKNDFIGALQMIPRNLRLMYVHAYQSLVWNFAAGERWRLYGDKVVEGDLVLVHEHRDKEGNASTEIKNEVDADGEVIIIPAAHDSARAADDQFTRARALSATEAASGQYSIFDIVLPLPGFDISYPANAMTDFYKRFMGCEEGGNLDPFDMRRKWKDVSLSGGYRKLLSRMGEDYSFEVKTYEKDDEQFVVTDLEAATNPESEKTGVDVKEEGEETGQGKLAMVLKFQLGTSQYATMALRELMKGRVKAYTPEFGGR